jgi:ABC-type uncharacterized transport system permease subunit
MSLLYLGGESAQMGMGLPSAITGLFQGLLLFYLLAADLFITFRLKRVAVERVEPKPAAPLESAHESLVPMIASTVVAATPLIYAALGETVVERSGVLNLGIEGMMLIGAVAGFAATLATGSDTSGSSRRPPPASRCRWPSVFSRSTCKPIRWRPVSR